MSAPTLPAWYTTTIAAQVLAAVKAVASSFQFPGRLLIENRRDVRLTRARMHLIRILSYYTGLTDSQIGEIMGGRNHSTIGKIRLASDDLMRRNEDFRQRHQTLISRTIHYAGQQ